MKKREKGKDPQAGVWKQFWKQRYLQIFVLVGIAYVFIFNYIPMVGLIIGFKDYKITSGLEGMFTSTWVGLKNFQEFFTDYKFPELLRNTLVLSILKLIFSFPIPILFAVLLNEVRSKKTKKFIQTVSYLPYFVSWVIVAGLLRIFASDTGIINNILMSMHLIQQPLELLTSPKYFTVIAVLTAIWKDTGWWAIVFLAAITGIDPTLYEAAEMDGASRIKRIRYITIPCISGTVTVVLIMALGNLLGGGLSGSNFEQCYLLGNQGNMAVSDIIQTYVMRIGLSNARYSFATAVGMFQSVISVTLVFISNFISKKVSGNGLF
ncbi:MAG: ABC transporter permease subunit [Lachnospiraceae bacterium]|nr:ABC transporter permease subunit [Lachnospiraceae bacterium]